MENPLSLFRYLQILEIICHVSLWRVCCWVGSLYDTMALKFIIYIYIFIYLLLFKYLFNCRIFLDLVVFPIVLSSVISLFYHLSSVFQIFLFLSFLTLLSQLCNSLGIWVYWVYLYCLWFFVLISWVSS